MSRIADAHVHTPRRLRSTDAYTFYLRGQSALDRGPAGWHEAQSDFEQALSLDPSFLRAAEKLTLAYGYEVTNSNAPGGTGWQHVREAADKTLHIDEHSSIAHADLGLLHGTYEYDWSAAETEYVMALASNSRDPIALEQSAWLALALGHYEQAARLEDDSLSLDPLNPSALEDRAYIERCTGDLAGAERAYRKAVEISPAFTENHLLLGEMLLLRGQHAAALTETQLAAASDGRDIGLAKVYFALGRTAESNAALGRAQRDFGDQWPHNIAEVYAYRGELDRAFEWLDRAYAARRHALPVFIRCDPLYAPLRGDPRYKTLLRKMNLPEP